VEKGGRSYCERVEVVQSTFMRGRIVIASQERERESERERARRVHNFHFFIISISTTLV
jgi:hypothetical protein